MEIFVDWVTWSSATTNWSYKAAVYIYALCQYRVAFKEMFVSIGLTLLQYFCGEGGNGGLLQKVGIQG